MFVTKLKITIHILMIRFVPPFSTLCKEFVDDAKNKFIGARQLKQRAALSWGAAILTSHGLLMNIK